MIQRWWTNSVPAILAFFLVSCDWSGINGNNNTLFFFDRPADIWEESFPLGNGRLGMMPTGDPFSEKIVLNEITMWSGSKQDTDNPNAYRALSVIRQLLFEDRNDEAQELMYQTFVCKGEGSALGDGANAPYGSYQILGNMQIDYLYPSGEQQTSSYRRELDMEKAISTVTFRKGNVNYKRELFTSFSGDMGVIHLSSDMDKTLNFRVHMDRPEHAHLVLDNKDLVMKGTLPDGAGGDGVSFSSRVRILLPKGGQLSLDSAYLSVGQASEAVILVSMGTDYYDTAYENRLVSLLDAAQKKEYATLKKEHLQTYQSLFNRVTLDLGKSGKEKLPIDERLHHFGQTKDDTSLAALYFHFGRYLLISSTRPGLLPPNLQGLWCNTIHTPWNGDYHLNINLQMNMWPAEVTNLSELHLPMIKWTMQQVASGERTARVFYNARGWVTHILGNVWEFTAPGEHPSWGATNTSAAWLCAHLYQHYQYTLDKHYLKEVYPVMKGAALFFVDMLIEDPRNHYLVTAPTTSPENAFLMPDGTPVYVSAGSTMDNQLVRELFANTMEAATILDEDPEFVALLQAKSARLMPTTIGADGRIMEWLQPYPEAEPQHRHVSHLYGLYPGNEITVDYTPELAEAARKTLEVRGEKSTGWSMAWKINFMARLKEGDYAYKLLGNLLTPSIKKGEKKASGGGSYPNLFCAHPPFQIDGNFGACAGIAEMLIQNHTDIVHFLPALPTAWPDGHFSGLKIRGGGEVSARWKSGQLKEASLKATVSRTYTIALPPDSHDLRLKQNGRYISLPVEDNRLTVDLKAGDLLLLTF